MKQHTIRGRLLASTLFAGVAAMAAPGAVAVLATLAPTTASAQDYTSGTLIGSVTDTSGAPVANAAVTVTSDAQGQTRNLTTDSRGQFRAPLIPQGAYSVSISKDGYQSTSDQGLAVRAGGESGYNFTLLSAGEGNEVDELVVTATANPQLDFSQTTTGLTIDIETLQKQVPIQRNITAVALMSPGTTEGSSTNFRGQASISGASVAENAFYLNGLNITNFDNYIGASTVPFDFYKSVEVKTGGYSAEYGRATGGIVNAVTKSGSNDFYFALHGNYAPDELQASQKDTPRRRGKYLQNTDRQLTVEAGGPIIRDHLFVYGLAQFRDDLDQFATIDSGQLIRDKNDDPFYGLKVDGYLTPTQHLEFTLFDTTRTVQRSSRAYSFDGTTDTFGDELPGTEFRLGGVSYVAKYTGTFTDWLTVSAAYGKNKDRNETISSLGDEALVQSVLAAGPSGVNTTRRVSFQNTGTLDAPRHTEREFFRGDVDIYFNLMGDHHIRAGFDREDLSLTHVSQRNGNANYRYLQGSDTDARGVPAGRIYMDARTFVGGGSYEGRNQAIYIQDSWDVTDTLTLNLGVRRDKFQNRGISSDGKKGDVFVDFDNEIAARIGFTWDPGNDGTNKIFGNYGRYYLPVASNTAYRQASAILDQTSFFLMPAGFQVYLPGTLTVDTNWVDPNTGLPKAGLAGTQIEYAGGAPCLPGGIGATGVNGCQIRNDGTVQPFISNTSRNLKSTADDEYLIGYERRINDLWTASATLTYRKSLRAADDVSIDPAVQAYCAREGIVGCENIWSGFHQYTIINPGKDATIVLTDPLPGETTVREVEFSAADLLYPEVNRKYLALALKVERAFDGVWGLNASYTISESKGNYEGYVKTDYAGGQQDAGITADFDTPGLLEGAFGLLPNHRAHVIKAFGSYQAMDNLLVGANVLVSSGRKYGCMGLNPNDPVLNDSYGALSHYCGGVMTPRGSVFSDPWTYRLDLSLRYTVPGFGFLPEDGLVLRADLFNVFNTRRAVESDEFGETDSGTINSTFRAPLAYTPARSLRLGFDLVF